MSYPQSRFKRALVAGVLGVMALGSAASAADSDSATGGTSVPDAPTVSEVRCDDGRDAACTAGRVLIIGGDSLQGVRKVAFLGARGRKDNQLVRATKPGAHAVSIRIPAAAKTGPVQLRASSERADAGVVTLDAPAGPASTAKGFAFPIDGKHEIGTSANQRFGGGRGHQGQDVFAKCGTPIVAALEGTVQEAKSQSAAGNYVVIDGTDGRSYVYLHMRRPAIVAAGDEVTTGQSLGEVGETGRATGCHLHFELWTAPGRYEGGEAINPLSELQEWEDAA